MSAAALAVVFRASEAMICCRVMPEARTHSNVKKKKEGTREPSSDELAVKAAMEAEIPARARTANSPSPWLAWSCYYVEEVERKMAKLTAS